MKKHIITALCLTSLLMGCGTSQAKNGLDLNDLLNLSSGDNTVVEEPARGNGFYGVGMVESSDAASGIRKIVSRHTTGVKVLKTPSGIAFVATGAGAYEKRGDINSSRIALRQAYTAALMDARHHLAATLNGLSLEAKTELSEINLRTIGSQSTERSSKSTLKQSIRETIDAMLGGYVTHSVYDDGNGLVYLSIVSSPVTRGYRAVSGGVLDAASLREGLQLVLDNVKKEVVPPAGAKLVRVPGTGEMAVISFGSAIIMQERDGTYRGRERLAASRRARAHADAAMLSFLKGEKILWEYGLHETGETEDRVYGEIMSGVDVDPSVDSIRRSFTSTLSGSTAGSAVVQGHLPAGVTGESFETEDGWCFAVDMYLPELEDAGNSIIPGNPVIQPEDPFTPDNSADTSFDDFSGLDFDPSFDTGEIVFDEKRGVVEICGQGAAPANRKGARGRLLARRAAIADMQRKFAEYLKGAAVHGRTDVADFEVGSDRVSSRVSALVRNVETIGEHWDGSFYTVKGRMNIKDVQAFLKTFRKNKKK